MTLTDAFGGASTAGFKDSDVHAGRKAALVGTGVSLAFA